MDSGSTIDELFHRAVELDASARQRLLDSLPAEPRRELEELLDYDQRPTGTSLAPLTPGPGVESESSEAPSIDGYRMRELLGAGGMGTVFLAEQLRPIERTVAVKVVREGLGSRDVLARFAAERQTLARMQHPNVASVFDGGMTDDGRPFFAMEYVDGPGLLDHADQRRLDVDARLVLFQQVCRGVEHAHRRGVIHRDLKPSNLLVADTDGEAVVKIIDFGVAKALQPEPGEARTLYGQAIGTPEYMAPEQRRGEEIDTRVDVHALGIVLHELLLGRRPSAESSSGRAGSVTPSRPTAPSTWWRQSTPQPQRAAIAARRACDETRLGRRLHGDLDEILLTATAEDPEARYADPRALAADIERHRQGLPIEARRASAGERAARFVRRNIALVSAVCIVIVGLGAALSWSMHETDRARTLLRDVRRLSDDRLIDELERSSRLELWPAIPARIGHYREWLVNWDGLESRLPAHQQRHAQLEARLAASTGPLTTSRRELIWELSILGELISKTEQLRDAESRVGVRGVQQRLSSALALRERAEDPVESAAWADAIRSIADPQQSPRYGGYRLPGRQVDLVPLGQNERSGLWEFWHVPSGTRPEWNANGSFRMRREDGLVLVLIPPGTFWMGARSHAGGPGPDSVVDARADKTEGPPHQVQLNAWFLSKFELTQGQVFAWTGNEASSLQASKLADYERPRVRVGWSNPIEQVSWKDAEHLLKEMGFVYPTEAQWEYAARGGRSGAWARGDDDSLPLDQLENFGDAPSERFLRKPDGSLGQGLDDGHAVHAPVGSFAPNGFGLFDMLGNVGELCLDWVAPYTLPVEPGTGLRIVEGRGNGTRAIRGGNYQSPPRNGRVSTRGAAAPTHRLRTVGVRPSRPVDGPTLLRPEGSE